MPYQLLHAVADFHCRPTEAEITSLLEENREYDDPSMTDEAIRRFRADVHFRQLIAEFVRPNHHRRAADVIAPSLVESNGLFTGKLGGPPIGTEEKARQVRSYAQTHDIDLAQSHAYGDSIADLPMLECVGFPHAVNPDRALAAIARERNWPVHQWSIGKPPARRFTGSSVGASRP